MKLQRKGGVPLYLQIKEHVLDRIEAGHWPPESMLPTENELCREYGVSKITVREAIKLLVRDGRLSRVPGRGTFVMKQKMEQKLDRFFSFTRWAVQNGLQPASRILKIETIPCDVHLAGHLGIREGEPVTRVDRLRLGNGEPLMAETIWLRASLCPDLHLHDLANVPFNDILRDEYGIALARAVETIEPQTADPVVSRLLAIEKDVLLLHVEHTAYTADGRIAYFVAARYRGDRVRFSVELKAV